MDWNRLELQLGIPFRSNAVKDVIQQLWNRVVAVECRGVKGTGILFRANNKTYVQTCYHVVEDSDDIAITVSHERNCEQSIVVVSSFLIGKCRSQDKAIYRIDIQPSFFRDMPDLGAIVVDVRLPGPQSSLLCIKGLVEYYNDDRGYMVHFYWKAFNGQPPSSCTVTFSDNSVANCGSIETCCNPGCYRSQILCSKIPYTTLTLFHRTLPWRSEQYSPVVMISHPNGNYKEHTVGRYMGMEMGNKIMPHADSGTHMVLHDAETSPGSSGGCAIIIGKESYNPIGYNSYIGMHIGQRDRNGYRFCSLGLIN
ncbi:uncharacterized protein LOC126811867 [Patella vulgata]|uniref:uncharacterized protein LOC126811867 n=1 Tax=Patella vulgata TaxID=6465 RepID=UPI00217F8CAE|nr:uncharacterized protein LOC126811867 [Patella vulgata]XP_055957253.1 uncharacterized protein LOC126811867 [Patella vulgata]